MNTRSIVLSIACLLVSMGVSAQKTVSPAAGERHGIDLDGMDRSVKVNSPADLYHYANGTWLDHTKIPADHTIMSRLFEIYDRNQLLLKSVAEEAARGPAHSGNAVRDLVGRFYRVAMDEKRANRLGAEPLRDALRRIERIHDRESLMSEIAYGGCFQRSPGFSVGVGPDDKDSSRTILIISKGGQMLPDRQMYLSADTRAKAIRAKYVETVARFFDLTHLPHGYDQARAALTLETILAKASPTPLETRDVGANYHLLTQAELQNLTPGVPWRSYFQRLGIAPPPFVNVAHTRFLAAFGMAVVRQPLATWRSYLRATLFFNMAGYLSDDFHQTSAGLSHTLYGGNSGIIRWKSAIHSTNEAMGEALDHLFVARVFSVQAKARAIALIKNLKAAFRERLQSLDWMSDTTKAEALKKLDAIAIKAGYPDKWRDYSALHLQDDSYAQNMIRAYVFEWQRELHLLGKPTEHSSFGLPLSEPNGYYDVGQNAVVLPAGLFQPGMFDPEADDASNYGAVGYFIGHELTHGFDDRGSQFDLHGSRRDWWSKDDRERFEARAKTIVAQYDAYVSPEGLPINGKLTLSENIADIGGLTIAYLAYHKALDGKEAPLRDGLTGDQRFCIAYAQTWRTLARPEQAKVAVATDWHSPPAVRAQGALNDLPEFYQAFGLSVPDNLPHIW